MKLTGNGGDNRPRMATIIVEIDRKLVEVVGLKIEKKLIMAILDFRYRHGAFPEHSYVEDWRTYPLPFHRLKDGEFPIPDIVCGDEPPDEGVATVSFQTGVLNRNEIKAAAFMGNARRILNNG